MPANPFSTRFIRPGAIPFIFPEGQSPESLVEKLRANRWHGQIIGPHGSGKSTLLATLIPAFQAAGRDVQPIALHQGEHRLPRMNRSTFATSTQLIIDGYEQLSWWAKRRVKSLCRSSGAGLLVTAHSDMGLYMLFQTQPSQQLARAVVARLTGDMDSQISSDDVGHAYAATNGDIREALFKLYDVYQQRHG